MANGTYGNIRPSDVNIDDIEIFYHYAASRNTIGNTELIKLDSTQVLTKIDNPNKTQSDNTSFEMFGGLYTLKLPANVFGVKGIYTIIIKPIEIRTKIIDTGVLSAFPDVKGLIFDGSSIPTNQQSKFENNGLIGYRIEYINKNQFNETKVNNLFRIITSNNRAEPVNQNLTNSNQKAIRYRFNDNSSLVFCTVTPSSAASVKPNVYPFIGQPNQDVILTNTYFDPIMLEIEMVEYDIESLAFGIYGNQSKSLEDGVYTIYNFNNEIYKQYNLYEIKDKFNGDPLYEIREQRNNIDYNKIFSNITTI